MIMIRYENGLGNQMFIYAFSLNFSSQNREIKHDLSFYDTYTHHNGFELPKIFRNIRLKRATLKDFASFYEMYELPGSDIRYRIKEGKTIYLETWRDHYTYNPGVASFDDCFFKGYWQHASYFQPHATALKKDFEFSEIKKSDAGNYGLLQQIGSCNSVGVHIRRGDYHQSPVHLVQPLSYYTKAIEIIRSRVGNPVFFIFSDDYEFARENFPGDSMVIVNNNRGAGNFRDMQLMSRCRHNIIANSTFSWWSAWLNPNDEKIVVAPCKWFKVEKEVTGLLLKEWTIIE